MAQGPITGNKGEVDSLLGSKERGGGLPHDQESAKNEKKQNMELLDTAKFKDNLLSNFRSPSHELGL